MLPEEGAGKLKKEQQVIIKLDDFPYKEFGYIRGVVTNISMITNEELTSDNKKISNYLVRVSLSNGLNTNNGTSLTIRSQAKGSAEIITDDKRLIQRLFDNLSSVTGK